jgi:hypothetical protein
MGFRPLELGVTLLINRTTAGLMLGLVDGKLTDKLEFRLEFLPLLKAASAVPGGTARHDPEIVFVNCWTREKYLRK